MKHTILIFCFVVKFLFKESINSHFDNIDNIYIMLWGHEWLFHEIARNFSNCCNFMKKFWLFPGIFLLLRNTFFSKKLFQQPKKFQIDLNFFFLLKQIFWEKREFIKKVNKKHVSPHLQHELMQHNSF